MSNAFNSPMDAVKANYEAQDPGNAGVFVIDRSPLVIPMKTAAAETRTLALPTKAGLTVLLSFVLDTGDCVVTVTGTYDGSNSAITFGTVGDWALLMSVKTLTASGVDTYKWRLLQCNGTGISGPTSSLSGAASVTSLTATGNVNAANTTVTNATITSATVTNCNSTTAIGATTNATNATITSLTATNANATTGIFTTCNATSSSVTNMTMGQYAVTATAVNAAGSVIGNAANLSYGMNIVNAADNAKGVILPVAAANAVVEIIQITNAKSLNVYPQVNSAIAGLGANTVFTTGVVNTAAIGGTTENVYFKFVATNATQWYVQK